MSDRTTKKVGIGSMIAGGVATATNAIAAGLGFTTSGIAAGSAAAGIQARIGSVVAGSAFVTPQSLGATGAFAALGVTGPIGLAIGGIFLLVNKLEENKRRRE